MSKLDSIEIEAAVAAGQPGRDLAAEASATATESLGEAIDGFQRMMGGKGMRMALTGAKVLLINTAVFAPLFALLALGGAF